VQYDSRRVTQGDLFVAIRGTATDGHRFIQDALGQGAAAVVLEDEHAAPDPLFLHHGAIKIVVADARTALARLSANFFGHPARRLRLIGVTGTNGKTTTTHLIKSVLEATGEKVGLIGTIRYLAGEEEIAATHTTPESLDLNRLLAHMVEVGCTAAVMEVSSHALALRRVDGLRFRAGVFTNLTQDHLDFHRTMEEYFSAKKTLFAMLPPDAAAVTNADAPDGERIVAGTAARVLTYGTGARGDIRAQDVRSEMGGTSLMVSWPGGRQAVRSTLTGDFNVQNILAAYATGVALNVAPGSIAEGIERLRAVPGRFEQHVAPAGWMAVIDYAHTPDALENCLRTLRTLLDGRGGGRIITVFGCGGDRDRGKRPLMGAIASRLSDLTVITSDNPRHEDPDAIIAEIRRGVVPGRPVRVDPDRRAAIAAALAEARTGDAVLVAGKGHETYQVVGDTRIHFDDREEVEGFLRRSA
jgi:UDP-N-acetylmuramoyl-L-alanyl-D-glutamate--2,6-diaminopimelate ligase